MRWFHESCENCSTSSAREVIGPVIICCKRRQGDCAEVRDAEVPEDRTMDPLEPCSPEIAVLMRMAPLVLFWPWPLAIAMLPPVFAALPLSAAPEAHDKLLGRQVAGKLLLAPDPADADA